MFKLGYNIKHTIEYVRQKFIEDGYFLLSKTYKNNKQKLKYRCPENHEHCVSWNQWQRGDRCPFCYRERSSQLQRKDIREIKQAFEMEGYQFLTTEYKNSKQKLDYVCPFGHQHSITWGDWKTGYRCAICGGTAKKNIEFIRSEFEKEGYQLLTTKYINSRQKLNYICPNGHKHSIAWMESGSKMCLLCRLD